MQLDQNSLAHVVRRVIEASAGCSVELEPGAQPPPRDYLACSVHYAGPWQGSFVLELPYEVSHSLVARALGDAEARVAPDRVRDVLGELVNVMAGNLKPLLPGECRLSMPAVAESLDHAMLLPGYRALSSAWFRSEAGCFRARVLSWDAAAGGDLTA